MKTGKEGVDLGKEPIIRSLRASLDGLLKKNGEDLEAALGKFIADAWSDGDGENLHLDKLRTDLTLLDWFHLVVIAPRESNLREIAMRKIEVEISRKCEPFQKDPSFFHGFLNTIDMKKIGLTAEQLIVLCEAIKENRTARGDAKGWKCRGVFWKDNPTSKVVLLIANTLHLSGKPDNCKRMLREAKEFREEASEKAFAAYGPPP